MGQANNRSGIKKGCSLMIEVDVPKEITEYKEKIIGGMSLRQLICFLIALILGGGSYALSYLIFELNSDISTYIVALVAIPPLAIGFVSPHGYPLERYVQLVLRRHTGNRKRPYRREIIVTKKDERMKIQSGKAYGKKAGKKEFEGVKKAKKDRSKNIG